MSYCMSKKSCPILYGDSLNKAGHDFLDVQYYREDELQLHGNLNQFIKKTSMEEEFVLCVVYLKRKVFVPA